METVAEKIERFLWYFGRHVDVILETDSGYESSLYARLLLTTLLDSFSKVAFADEKSVSKRYIRFVVEFCGWKDVERVSLLHLQRLLANEARLEFSEVREWVDSQFLLMFPIDPSPRTVIRRLGATEQGISVDPTLQEILLRWPHNSGVPFRVGTTGPEDLKHGALLYQYRNHLVHEFRVPGDGWDVAKKGDPFYQKMTEVVDNLKPIRERWELVYPLGFLGVLCRTGLVELGALLRREGRNPFKVFTEGSFWLPALNVKDI